VLNRLRLNVHRRTDDSFWGAACKCQNRQNLPDNQRARPTAQEDLSLFSLVVTPRKLTGRAFGSQDELGDGFARIQDRQRRPGRPTPRRLAARAA
jgi:hypothetical protein